MASTVINATLDLASRGLGFSIIGGTDAPARDNDDLAIYLSNVAPNGAAALGGLRAGDRLVTVNGTSLTGSTHEDAVALIGAALTSLSVDLSVVRDSTLSGVTATTTTSVAETPLNSSGISSAASLQASGVDLSKGRKVAARAAFASGDKELSKMVHDTMSQENHQSEAGQYIKAAVFGGLDGIITTFAVVASVAGANLSIGVVIIMGFSNLIADGISMGFGEYISMQSERDYIQSERNREEWEYENSYESEIAEMVELYEEKGFSKREAEAILNVMGGHKEFFIDHMLVQELGMMPPDEEESPLKSGLVMFFSFLGFGIIPLLAYIALSQAFPKDMDPAAVKDALFGIACGLTALALFVLGAVKSKFGTQTWYASGLWMLANGALAAAAAYLIGWGIEQAIGEDALHGSCSNNSTNAL